MIFDSDLLNYFSITDIFTKYPGTTVVHIFTAETHVSHTATGFVTTVTYNSIDVTTLQQHIQKTQSLCTKELYLVEAKLLALYRELYECVDPNHIHVRVGGELAPSGFPYSISCAELEKINSVEVVEGQFAPSR